MTKWKETTRRVLRAISTIILLLGFSILIYAATVYMLKNISSEISKGILDYIRVIVWPAVALIVVAVFRSNLAQLIERLEEGDNPFLGKWKASHLDSVSQQEGDVVLDTETQGADPNFDKVIEEREAEIGALKDNEQQLLDKLTIAEIELDFERIYNLIFASQIELLAKLSVNSPVDISYVVNHYSGVQRANRKALKDWNVGQYMAYLLRMQLVELNDSMTSITSKGRAFISYLNRMSYRKYDL